MLILQNSVLLIIDIQEKFRPTLFNAESLIQNTQTLLKGCVLLDVPIVVSEQYPHGLGHTVTEILDCLPAETPVFEKTSFGCYDDTAIQAHLKHLDRKQVIICGLEAHVCVMQTALRLLEEGYEVYIVEDALGARSEKNAEIAMKRLTQAGAIAACVEMTLLELMRSSKHTQFKVVQALIK